MVVVKVVRLVVVILFVVLGDIRSSLIVVATLIITPLCTFMVMNHYDISANLMSLGGLAIAIGMLVDAAVVVVENIVTHLQEGARSKARLPRLHLIYLAVRELAVPVSAVMKHEGKSFVFVPDGSDRFRRVDVTTGIDSDDRIEVTSGLSVGQQVVSQGAFVLKSELLLEKESE
jgi:hypothetical protein